MVHTVRMSCLVVALLLAGCPAPDPDPPSDDDDATDPAGDDDDATDPVDDDDATDPPGDDDDSAPGGDDDDATDPVDLLCPDDVEPDPIDLTDGEAFVNLAFAITEMRLLGELTRFGLIDAHPNCPQSEGDHPGNSSGTLTWLGGCTTKGGVDFAGSLTQTWVEGGSTSTSEDWQVTGTGVNFDELEFSGSWSASEVDGGIERADAAEGLMRLTGSKRGYLDGTNFPFGISGSYAWTGDWTDPAVEVHTFTVDAVAVCRSPVTAFVEVVQTSGVCFTPVPDQGTVTVEAEGHTATIDFGSAADCSGCWSWSLDGVEQPEPACSHGF